MFLKLFGFREWDVIRQLVEEVALFRDIAHDLVIELNLNSLT